MASKEYVQHPHSPLRSRANYVAHLVQEVDDIEYTEQVWLETEPTTNPQSGVLLSAPFFVYGYSLLDSVELDGDGRILQLTEASGRSLFRVFLADAATANRISEQLTCIGADHLEWMNHRYVCVDCPTKHVVDEVWKLLSHAEASGELEFETANLVVSDDSIPRV